MKLLTYELCSLSQIISIGKKRIKGKFSKQGIKYVVAEFVLVNI